MAGGALETFVSNVVNMAASGSFRELAELCRRAIKDVLAKNVSNLENVLASLVPSDHSIAVLAVLSVRIGALMKDGQSDAIDATVAQLADFIKTDFNNEQIRWVPDIYTEIFRKVGSYYLQERAEPDRPVELIAIAIDRLAKSKSQLTSLHSTLCCLCLKTQNYAPVLPFLDADITDICKEQQQGNQWIDSLPFLGYFYYGGMIYTALKNYERALFFFETVVTTPAVAMSAVMVEAHKKYQLISLIVHGEVIPLPNYKSTLVQRFIKQQCQEYNRIINICVEKQQQPKDKARLLTQHLDAKREVFERDSNVGLVRQVITALYKRNIHRLTKTFMKLSLSDVANRCCLTGGAVEARRYVSAMIDSGEIVAEINDQQGMVRFQDSSGEIDAAAVNTEMSNVMQLERRIHELDKEAQLNPQYVSKVAKGFSGGSIFASQGGIAMHDDEGVAIQQIISSFPISELLNV